MSYTLTRFTTEAVTVDGDLAEWANDLPTQLVYGQDAVDPDDLSATCWTRTDGKHFFLAVRVQDDLHNQNQAAGNMWKNDSIQFSLDPLLERHENAYGPNDMEIGFALPSEAADAEPIRVLYVGPDGTTLDRARAAIVRDDKSKITTYELAIPLADLGKLAVAPGRRFGFNLAVHDADEGLSRESILQITPGTSLKDPAAYHAFTVIAR